MYDNEVVNTIWAEKYRPQKIVDMILPDRIARMATSFVEAGHFPNLMFAGRTGVGKTTLAKVLCNELEHEYILINTSLHRNIDTLRNEIVDFASAMAMNGKRKCVILDEFDHSNANSLQPALRGAMEEYASTTSFIMTCNYKNKIIEPLHSRTSFIDFTVSDSKEKLQLSGKIARRLMTILKTENVEFDNRAILHIIEKYFPDIRVMLNEMQRYASENGKIDVGILTNISNKLIEEVVPLLKKKNFKDLREWVGKNSDLDFDDFVSNLYTALQDKLKEPSLPSVILHLAEYSYRKAFVVDMEIHLAAMLLLVMSDAEFKD